MSEDWIGLRVARYRDLAGLTQQQLADRIGKSRPYLSQIENGSRSVTTRALLISLAEALNVSTTDLTGNPRATRDRVERPLHVAVPSIRAALDGALDPNIVAVDRLVTRAADLAQWRMDCDYPSMGAVLPHVLAGVKAHAEDDGGAEAHHLLTRVLVTASLTLRPLGYLDLATRLAERAQAAALNTEDPAAMGAAAFARSQCSLAGGVLGMRQASQRMAIRAANALQPLLGRDDAAATWYGLLHLQAGLAAASMGEAQGALHHVDEARRATPLAPAVDKWTMDFSDANVGVWETAIFLEGPSPDLAPDVASRVQVNDLRTVQRRAHLMMHTAQGHYARGAENYGAATSFLIAAETLAPGEVRGRSRVREIVGQMLRDARRSAGGDRLRSLAAKVGVDPYIED